MRAATLLGLGSVAKTVSTFQQLTGIQWTSLSEQPDVAVVFGGDGTVHRYLPQIVGLGIPLLVVPCGSGNDFARALRIRNVKDAAGAWRRFAERREPSAIDLGVITPLRHPEPQLAKTPPHFFCCVAGVGIDGTIAKRANSLPGWIRAHGGYALCAPAAFLQFAPFPMRVSTSESKNGEFRPTILAAVANAPAYGGGMKIAPKASLNDGRLDLCVVRGMSPFKLFCRFPTVYFGHHLGFKEVEYFQTKSVTVETEFPFDVYADGEHVCQTPAAFAIASGALKVLVP